MKNEKNESCSPISFLLDECNFKLFEWFFLDYHLFDSFHKMTATINLESAYFVFIRESFVLLVLNISYLTGRFSAVMIKKLLVFAS